MRTSSTSNSFVCVFSACHLSAVVQSSWWCEMPLPLPLLVPLLVLVLLVVVVVVAV